MGQSDLAKKVLKEHASGNQIEGTDYRQVKVPEIAEVIEQAAANMGFAICAWGSSSIYNRILAEDAVALAPLGDNRLVVMVGNTASIWPIIEKQKQTSENPFEEYAERASNSLIDLCLAQYGLRPEVRFTNDMSKETMLCFRRLAKAMSNGEGAVCGLSKEVQLLFHLKYGSWHAWRFALVFNHVELKATQQDWDKVMKWQGQMEKLVLADEIEKSRALTKNGTIGFDRQVAHLWLRARQVFSLGREHIYPPEMLMHHYPLVDKSCLVFPEEKQGNDSDYTSCENDNDQIPEEEEIPDHLIDEPRSENIFEQSPPKSVSSRPMSLSGDAALPPKLKPPALVSKVTEVEGKIANVLVIN